MLGIKDAFLAELSKTVIEVSKDAYPELADKKEHIFATLNKEEENFNKTIDTGLTKLNDIINDMKQNNEKVMSGENAFKLYDTYGFPLDLTIEILEEKGLEVDGEGFDKAMKKQKKA